VNRDLLRLPTAGAQKGINGDTGDRQEGVRESER
jgi:hypothetical protein